jgi:hypothetical protein
VVRHVVEDARGDADVFGHGPVDPVAEAFAGVVEVVETAAGHGIVLRDDRGGLGDDAVAFLPVFDLLADLDDMAAELMTEDDGVVDRPGMIGGPLVEVRSADPDIGDFEEDVLGSDRGFFDFADFDGVFVRGVVDDGGGFHWVLRIKGICGHLRKSAVICVEIQNTLSFPVDRATRFHSSFGFLKLITKPSSKREMRK